MWDLGHQLISRPQSREWSQQPSTLHHTHRFRVSAKILHINTQLLAFKSAFSHLVHVNNVNDQNSQLQLSNSWYLVHFFQFYILFIQQSNNGKWKIPEAPADRTIIGWYYWRKVAWFWGISGQEVMRTKFQLNTIMRNQAQQLPTKNLHIL